MAGGWRGGMVLEGAEGCGEVGVEGFVGAEVGRGWGVFGGECGSVGVVAGEGRTEVVAEWVGGCGAGGIVRVVGVGGEVGWDVEVEEGWVGEAGEELGVGAVGGLVLEQVGPEGGAGGEGWRGICWVGGQGLRLGRGACWVSLGYGVSMGMCGTWTAWHGDDGVGDGGRVGFDNVPGVI